MRGRYLALDGLRGIAALFILVRHSEPFFAGFPVPDSFLAVDLFFVLSGFVLGHAYGADLESGMTPVKFMRLRLIRLYPLYLLGAGLACVAVFTPAGAAGLDWSAGKIAIAALTMLFMVPCPPIAGGGNIFPLNPPAWSLFFELAANLAMALVWKRLTLRVVIAICAISGFLFAGFTFQAGRADLGFAWPHFAAGFARVAFSFFAGVALYFSRERLPGLHLRPGVLLTAAAASLSITPSPQMRPFYDLSVIVLGFPLLVAVGVRAPVSPRIASLMTFLGVVSYPIYVLHVPVQYLLLTATDAMGVDVRASSGLAGLVLMALLGTGAWWVAKIYDEPVRRWLTSCGAARQR